MSKFVIFPNSYIEPNIIVSRPYAVSLSKLRTATWMNQMQMIKCLKNTATRNSGGVILFDNRLEACCFANKYSGYVTDLKNGELLHSNSIATAFDPALADVVKFNTNTYGHTISTVLWEDATFIFYDSPAPSLRPTTYLTLPEIKHMAKK